MAGETPITIVGNLVEDPELKFTSSGIAVAKCRVASTPRSFDKTANEWKDGEPLFMACTIWRQPGENVAESLKRGDRVVVTGRLRQRSYETQQGEKRTVVELEVDEIGPSLRYATAKVQKMQRSGGNSTRPVETVNDPFATPEPARTAPAQTVPIDFDDKPPF